MRVRSSRIISYAAGWAVMTVLAASVVWWGLGPLLKPIMQSDAAPAQPSSPPVPSPNPVPSPSPSPSPTRAVAVPRPSMFEGWQVIDGAFVRTFELEGGKATMRIRDGEVELVSSQPNPGYTITSERAPHRHVVYFTGPHHFVLDVIWWQDKPYYEITQVS